MSHITRKLVWLLGVSQLVCWGISYYLIGLFGNVMAAELGLSLAVAFGGFTAALLVMGLTSTAIGKAIDRWGGRPVMVAGSLLSAAGCLGLAAATGVVGYYASWLVLGLAMRATLYDAAFAALARLGGPQARKPISQITLLGGLASTTLWPVGQALADAFGWRGALVGYAVLALLTIPLHAAIPAERYERRVEPGGGAAAGDAERPCPVPGAPLLFALIVAATGLLASGLSAHMIGILGGLGVAHAGRTPPGARRRRGLGRPPQGEVTAARRTDSHSSAVPSTVRLALKMPAMSSSEPFGFHAPSSRLSSLSTAPGPIDTSRPFDYAIRRDPAHFAGLKPLPLMPERCAPVCSPALAGLASIRTPADLTGQTIITIRARTDLWPAWCAAQGLELQAFPNRMEVDHTYFAMQAAEDGLGVAVIPLLFVERSLATGRLTTPLGAGSVVSGHYYLLESRQRGHTEAPQFRDWLIAQASDG